MKQIATSFLILLLSTTFLYNVVGMHLLFSLEREEIWIDKMKQIDDADFKVITLNASLYSFIEDSDLEYVNENITINGKVFHVFKKQIKDNIIRLYYLANEHQSAATILLKKIVNEDVFQNTPLHKKPVEKLFKSFLKDYVQVSYCSQENNKIINIDIKKIFNYKRTKLFSGYLSLLNPPPKLV